MKVDNFKSTINGHLNYYGQKIGREPFHPKTKEEIKDFLEDFLKSYLDALPFKLELKAYLEESYAQIMEEDMTIRAKSKDRNHVEWLSEEEKVWKDKIYTNSQFSFYRNSFEKKHGPMISFDLDNSTDEILADMENPNRTGKWETKGMVVGDVQSGKTANYSGLIAKAIDKGYKLIIVMTGIFNSLRIQTQDRLMDNLIKTSDTYGDNSVFKVNFMTQKPTYKTINGIRTLDVNGDFNATTAQTIGLFPNLDPTVFVIKKNVPILSNILIWLNKQEGIKKDQNHSWEWSGYRKFIKEKLPDHKLICDLPVLLIDDECDSASIDISKRDVAGPILGYDPSELEDYRLADPSKTNSLIRRILASFNKSCYIGYTATPLANIFIDYTSIKKTEGRDLFPRDFIKILKRYKKYQSPKDIFGEAERNFEDDNEIVSLSEDIDIEQYPQVKWLYDYRDDHKEFDKREDIEESKKEQDSKYRDESSNKEIPNGWMPLKHKMHNECLYQGDDDIPPSLKKAVRSFLIVMALRKIRKNKIIHNSMLIHVSRFVNVQQKVKKQISNYLKKIRQSIQNEIDVNKINTEKEFFFNIWDNDILQNIDISKNPNSKKINFDNIWEFIKDSLCGDQSVEVVIINSKSVDNLDYEKHKKGWNVIVIGGAAISRGITLEGLSISYFLRIAATPVSDTLMQMGRWFGYREGYEDLYRIYCPKLLHVLFRQFTYASEFARGKFAEMQGDGGEESKSPVDYAMEIPSFPGWQLISAVKSKDIVEFHEPLFSYASKIHQNILYPKHKDFIKQNLELTNNLLDQVVSCKKENEESINKRIVDASLWTPGVLKEKIDHKLDEGEIFRRIPKIKKTIPKATLWRDVNINNVIKYLANYKQPRRSFNDSHAQDIAFRLSEIVKKKKDIKWNLGLWSIGGNKLSKKFDFSSIKNHTLMERGVRNYDPSDHFSLPVLSDPMAEFMDIDKITFNEGIKNWIKIYQKTGKTEKKKTNMLPSGFGNKIRQKRTEGLFVLYPFTLKNPYYKEGEVHVGWQIIIPPTRTEDNGDVELIYNVALNRVAYEHRIQNIKDFQENSL